VPLIANQGDIAMPSGQKPRPTTYTQYWIQDGWIYHPDQSNSAKYWITDNWIYGPVGGGTGKEILTGLLDPG
jgi:hypothetical protein